MSDWTIGRVVYRGPAGLHGLLAHMIEDADLNVEIIGEDPTEVRHATYQDVVVAFAVAVSWDVVKAVGVQALLDRLTDAVVRFRQRGGRRCRVDIEVEPDTILPSRDDD